MIDLAISIDEGARGTTIVETNHGDRLVAPNWPQDSDFRLVVFTPEKDKCDVISPRELADDIALALEAIKPTLGRRGRKPEWYRRLEECAAGANDTCE